MSSNFPSTKAIAKDEFKQPAAAPKLVSAELKYCINEKPEKHQNHTIADDSPFGGGFKCHEVVEMEKTFGRHLEGCVWVGYLAATKCGCSK